MTPRVVFSLDDQDDRNARLIAAVPELLEAALAVVTHHARFDDLTPEAANALRGLRAAVAKARGDA